jgi:hypothetical protein
MDAPPPPTETPLPAPALGSAEAPALVDAAPPPMNARSRDLAIDIVAARFPRDTAFALRARDRASFHDPNLQLILARAIPA